jgi:hypothetical protein
MEQLGSHWKDFHEILYLRIIQKSLDKMQVYYNLTGTTGTLHKDLCAFMASRRIFLGMRNYCDKSCGENHNWAFPRQQWLRERALGVTLYVHCLSCFTYAAFDCLANELFVLSDGVGLCSL